MNTIKNTIYKIAPFLKKRKEKKNPTDYLLTSHLKTKKSPSDCLPLPATTHFLLYKLTLGKKKKKKKRQD